MTDQLDLAQRHEEFRREIGLRAARAGAGHLASPGSFGLCDDCGDPIEAERRKAMPSATRCIQCQEGAERHLRLHAR